MVVVVEVKGFDKKEGERKEQLQKQQLMVPPPPVAAGQQQPEASDTAWGLGSHPPDLQDGDIRRGQMQQCATADLQQQQVQQPQPQQQQQQQPDEKLQQRRQLKAPPPTSPLPWLPLPPPHQKEQQQQQQQDSKMARESAPGHRLLRDIGGIEMEAGRSWSRDGDGFHPFAPD